MAFRPLVGTLAYLWDRRADTILMVRRDARPDDDHFGKVNGLGGKLEPDESVVAGLRRELREEAGLELTSFALRGTVTWTNFGPKREQWLAFIFLVDGWDGVPPDTNEEGTLLTVPRRQVLAACEPDPGADALPMWSGDRHFVPLVFDGDPRPFHGTMPYDGDEPIGWTVERIDPIPAPPADTDRH
ncbi:MAG: 8-oxo-dGTP diphosphatase [Actinomycetota bacterium]